MTNRWDRLFQQHQSAVTHFPRAAWRRGRVHFMMMAQGTLGKDKVYYLMGYRQPWKKAR